MQKCSWLKLRCPLHRSRECDAPESEACVLVLLTRALLEPPEESGAGPPPEIEALSLREREIVRIFLSGKRPSEIAGALHISVHTARNHFKAIFRKMGVSSQVELYQKLRSSVRLI